MPRSRIIVMLSLSLFAGGLILTATSGSAAKSKANTKAGTYTFDLQMGDAPMERHMMSFLKTGEVVADGFLLPAALSGKGGPLPLGPGHGSWKFKSAIGKFQIKIAFREAASDEGYWLLTGQVPTTSGGFAGNISLKHFAAIDDQSPEQTTTVGIHGDVQEGTGI